MKQGWNDKNGVLHPRELLLLPEIIWTNLISRHHNNALARHFGINKNREFIGRKYNWLHHKKEVESYVKGCDVCLGSKAVKHKLYGDFHAWPIPAHCWKNLSSAFVTSLLVLIDWKGKSYDFILVILKRLTKMVNYKVKMIIINALGLVEVILNMIIWHHVLPNSIISDRGLLFTSKFWSLLCYFFKVRRCLSTAFHL